MPKSAFLLLSLKSKGHGDVGATFPAVDSQPAMLHSQCAPETPLNAQIATIVKIVHCYCMSLKRVSLSLAVCISPETEHNQDVIMG